MPLSSEDRKRLLGHGGLSRIARRVGRSIGHVAEVNKRPAVRPDQKVIRAIAREIVRRHPHIALGDVWPESVVAAGREAVA